MIAIYHWDPTAKTCQHLEPGVLSTTTARQIPADQVWWIDLQAATADEERLVFEVFLPVHPLTLEDITKATREPAQRLHFPKAEEFPDYLFVVVNPLRPDLLESPEKRPRPGVAKRGTNVQLSAVLTQNVLVTHHYEPLPTVERARRYLERHGEQAERGPDFLFHLVLDRIVDEYAPVVDRVAAALDRIESRVIRRPEGRNVARLLRLKRIILALRKTLILEREVLARLTRGEFQLVDAREMAYYRNVYDHLVRYTELIEGAREMVSDLMQTHLSAVSNNLNGIMKVLTMISTVVLPMNLIAGIYGMNFEELYPDVKWRPGFAFALGLMMLSGLLSLAFFYWKGWVGSRRRGGKDRGGIAASQPGR